MVNWTNIASSDPNELRDELKKHFTISLPLQVETTEDMKNAQKLLSKLASQYSFLTGMSVEVKGQKRRLKREKAGKEQIELMIEREELLNAYCDSVKMGYNAVSRMITIRQQIYEELKMTNLLP